MQETLKDGLISLGVITRAHGLSGEVLFRPYNPESDTVRPGLVLHVQGKATSLVVKGVRAARKGLLVRFEGIEDRTAAEALSGLQVACQRSDLPPVKEGEFYFVDVIGVRCTLEDGQEIGRVKSVFKAATDVLVIEGPSQEFLVPVVEGMVLKIGPEGVVLDRSAVEPPV